MEAKKFDSDKLDYTLVQPAMVKAISESMGFGAKKYGRDNYRLGGFSNMRLTASLLRHVFAYIGGEDNDPESGLPHLSHMAANVQMLVTLTDDGTLKDERFTKPENK